jgi:hypothetical protein
MHARLRPTVIMLAWWAALLAVPARAHFVFVVPDDRGLRAEVVFSESLDADPDVDDAPLETMVLAGRSPDGRTTPLPVRGRDTGSSIDLPGGVTSVAGRLDYGVMARGGAEPFLLVYHPRAILGDPFAAAAQPADDPTPRITPRGTPGAVQFLVEAAGRPVADADVTVILPDGAQEKVKTGPDGLSPTFAARGRYGAWARHVERVAGEHAGKPYAQVRHYPTIVCMIPDTTAADAEEADDEPADAAPRPTAPATRSPTTLLPPLPEASSSLGAVASDGFLYVYGGHIAPVHTYSTEAVSGRFHRLALRAAGAGDGTAAQPAVWEELAAGPRLQGMNLAAHGGRIYRVGGMDPRNAPGEEADNFSIASAACFDPAAGRWIDLPPLPEPRSSHDLVVLGDTLYAVGGWNMLGADGGEEWCETMAALDLTAATPEWRSIPQPFTRRALIATAFQDRLWVIGGFTDMEEVSTQVDVFDPATGTWGRGPNLPAGSFNGFAPAACVAGGRLLVSVADGSLLALDAEAGAWETVARTSPRIVHRMVPTPGGVILVGGAAGKDNLDRVERVALP